MQQVHEFFFDLRQHGIPKRLADAIDAWRHAADAVAAYYRKADAENKGVPR